MARSRVDARADLDRPERNHAERLSEVDQIGMVAHQLLAVQGRRLLLPPDGGGVELGEVGVEVPLEDGLVLGVQAPETIRDRTGGRLPALRAHVVVRVAHRVLVAERAVEARRDFEHGHVDRAVDVARRIADDPWVLRGVEKRWQEGVLRLEAEQQEHVGFVQQRREARFHGHRVNVLHAGRDAVHVQEVAPDAAGHVGQVRNRGDHLDLVRGATRSGQNHERRDRHGREQSFHHHALLIDP